MAEYDFPFAAIRQRSSVQALPTRNIRISSADDFTITVTVYQDEDATAPLDVTLATPVLYVYRTTENCPGLWWDYGMGWLSGVNWRRPIFEVQADVPSADSGTPNMVLDFVRGNYLEQTLTYTGVLVFNVYPYLTTQLNGRYAFAVFLATPGGLGQALLRGILDIERGPQTAFGAPVFDLGIDVLDGPDVLA